MAVSYSAECKLEKNGNTFSDAGMQLWTLDGNGKVTRYEAYPDTAAILKAWNG